MILYHGSPNIIEKPIYGVGNVHNDYGLGFYCTENNELAKEWACAENVDGFSNQYELDLSGMEILDLSSKEHCILHWITLLVLNRKFRLSTPLMRRGVDWLSDNFYINADNYDIIIGYRADDSYFSYAQSFIENSLSLESLTKAMKLGNLGKQIVLVSNKAFKNIKYLDSISVDKNEYYTKFKINDTKARINYQKIKSFENETYVMDIIRRGNK